MTTDQIESQGRGAVAVDAMGGDSGPSVSVLGALHALEAGLGPIILVGQEHRIQAELETHDASPDGLRIIDAPEIISMADSPGRAARSKRNSSMHAGFRAVQKGEAIAFISAGNSGAMMATGLLTVKRVPSCDRPAIAAVLPTLKGPTVLLDVGANVECRAVHLMQFALMGSAYAQAALGIERPSIGLVANGSEPNKGTESLREAHRLLNQLNLKYMGFIEGHDITRGECDVVVTDGLVGNVVLKLSEALAADVYARLERSLSAHFLSALVLSFLKKSMKKMREELDWESIGGAPILGLDCVAYVTHGSASPRSIANTVRRARESHELDLINVVRNGLDQGFSHEQTTTAELPLTRPSGEYPEQS